jgi:hypothetical protein
MSPSRMSQILVAIAILFAGTGRASVIFTDLGAGNTYDCCTGDGASGSAIVSGPLDTADTFTPSTTATFGDLLIGLSFFPGTGEDDLAVVSLVDDSSGSPTGAVLESWDVGGLPQFGTTSSIVQTLVTDTTITLTSGTPYWILIAPEDANSDVVWNASLTSGAITEINSGSGWTTTAGEEAFEVDSSSSPEPGSWLLLGTGIALMAAKAARWRSTQNGSLLLRPTSSFRRDRKIERIAAQLLPRLVTIPDCSLAWVALQNKRMPRFGSTSDPAMPLPTANTDATSGARSAA